MKIAITGLGVISCCGNSVAEFWDSVRMGKSGLANLTRFNSSIVRTKLVGKVKNFELSSEFDHKIRTKTDLHIQYALQATSQAFAHSQLEIINPFRVSTIIGTCSGSYDFVQNNLQLANANHDILPSFLTGSLNNMMAGYINSHYGIMGAGTVVSSACASGSQAIAYGAMLIETGQADAVIVGGSENWINQLPIGGLESLRALTYDPAGCKPFDKSRSGFSISEGAAILILESYDHAKKRNANVLAWLVGYGLSSDAGHPTAPRSDGLATKNMIIESLNRAQLNLEDVDYINAHATGTLLGDAVESNLMNEIFQQHPYISSTKAVTGHSIGAVGAMEAIITVLSLQNQTVPLTTNLSSPDCAGRHVIGESIDHKLTNAVSNNFGFGGTNSVLIFQKN